MKNPRWLALVTIAFWSFASLLSRLIAARSRFALVGLSFAFTALALIAYAWISQGRFPLADRRIWRIKYLALGSLGYFWYTTSLNQCYRTNDAATEPTLLNYTWPLFTVLFTRLLQRAQFRVRGAATIEALGIGAGFLSVALVATGGDLAQVRLANLPGVAWGLFAGATYGLFGAYSSAVPQDEHSAFLLASILASCLLIAPLAATERNLWAQLRWADVATTAALGCVLNGVAYITWTRANRRVYELGQSVSGIASMTLALPLLNLLWVAVFFHETAVLRPVVILSAGLIVVSMVLCQRAESVAQQLFSGTKG